MNDNDDTMMGRDARSERVFRTCEALRAELAPLVHPKALGEMLDLSAQAMTETPVEDVFREMRALVAGMLLNRVGDFLVATQPAVENEGSGLRQTIPARASRMHAA
jgi:hypothetical protein